MKTPIDTVTGRIVNVDEHGYVTIVAHYDDIHTFLKRGYQECRVEMIDSRPVSRKQQNTCYKLLREIANHTGMGLDPTKEVMKKKFFTEDLLVSDNRDFSLSDAPMSLVCAFQRYLVRFMLDWDIPASFPLLEFVDDVSDYIYACLLHKKCCICGKPADLHHVRRVGMGGDRRAMVHEGMEALPLCRIHHTELHSVGDRTFYRRYHIERGVRLDKELCRIYNLRSNEEYDKADGDLPF